MTPRAEAALTGTLVALATLLTLFILSEIR